MSYHLGLGDLIRAGGRALSRYTGTVLAVFAAQGLVAGVAIVAIAQLLATALAHRPLFDDAVGGDLAAFLEIVRGAPELASGVLWIVVGVVLLWLVASWFLVGGVLAVLADRPDGRAETARCFGAGGANTFLAFVVLQVVSLVAYVPALFVLWAGLGWGADRAEYALTIGDLAASLGLGAAPGVIALVIAGTIVDYARAELAARKSSHELGPVRAFVRAGRFVAAHPITLIHAALGWLAAIGLGVGYVALTHGRGPFGGAGALTIFVVRQALSLLRIAIDVGVLGGQVALGLTRPPPPRPRGRDASARRA